MAVEENEEEEDRYNRLKNVREFGYDIDFTDLAAKSVAIVGVGGLGSVSSEMLARCGIGRLVLFDLDVVDEVNLNRMFFMPEHVGRSKVEVVAEVIHKVNPDVVIEPHHGDIMAPDFEYEFESLIKGVDIVLNGLDNYPARQYLNQKCIKWKQVYIDGGASRSGMGGYVQPVIPRKTACYACVGSVDISSKKERGEPCTASLPTTMTLLAALQVQEALKYLLEFGKLSTYLAYNAVTNELTKYKTSRDPNCQICGDKAIQGDGAEIVRGDVELTSDEDLQREINKLKEQRE